MPAPGKPWYFSCQPCFYTHRPGDIAALRHAVMRKILAREKTSAQAPVHSDDYYLPDQVS